MYITPYLSVLSPNAGKYGPEKNSAFGQLSRSVHNSALPI